MNRTRSITAFFLAAALAHLSTGPLAAQVGAAPGASPFRDIIYGNGWTFTAGHVYGDGGLVRMSPNSGRSFALRVYTRRYFQILIAQTTAEDLDDVLSKSLIENPCGEPDGPI